MKIFRLYSDANSFSHAVCPALRWWAPASDRILCPDGDYFPDNPDGGSCLELEADGDSDSRYGRPRPWARSVALHHSALVVDSSTLDRIRQFENVFSVLKPAVVTSERLSYSLVLPRQSESRVELIEGETLRTHSGAYLASRALRFLSPPAESLFLVKGIPYSDVFASEALVSSLLEADRHGLLADLVWDSDAAVGGLGRREHHEREYVDYERLTSSAFNYEVLTLGDRFLCSAEGRDGGDLGPYLKAGVEMGILRF